MTSGQVFNSFIGCRQFFAVPAESTIGRKRARLFKIIIYRLYHENQFFFAEAAKLAAAVWGCSSARFSAAKLPPRSKAQLRVMVKDMGLAPAFMGRSKTVSRPFSSFTSAITFCWSRRCRCPPGRRNEFGRRAAPGCRFQAGSAFPTGQA